MDRDNAQGREAQPAEVQMAPDQDQSQGAAARAAAGRADASSTPSTAAASDAGAPTGSLAKDLSIWREQLLIADVDRLDDQACLEVVHQLELVTRAAAALSARVQVGFHASQVAQQIQDGVAPSRAGRAVPDDLALARMTSPYWGSRELTSAKALVTEMPRTLDALAQGTITSHQARVITEATTCLDPADRAEVDLRLRDRLSGCATSEIAALVKGLVYDVDPAGFVARARKAAADRGVSIRPAPDVMALLTGRLPAPQAVACYQALASTARAARASGDPRTEQQLMADELFSRLTGRTIVEGVDVEVGLVMTDAALFTGASDPADLIGYGPIPASVARDLLASDSKTDSDDSEDAPTPAAFCPQGERCTDFSCTLLHGYPAAEVAPTPRPGAAPRRDPGSTGGEGSHRAARAWVRRLYVDPVTGVLTRRDPHRRAFTGSLRAFLVARDRTCRNSWCGAPIRTIDHITRHSDGGSTDPSNGRGLCERCNLARERPRHLAPPPSTYRPAPPLLPNYPRRQ